MIFWSDSRVLACFEGFFGVGGGCARRVMDAHQAEGKWWWRWGMGQEQTKCCKGHGILWDRAAGDALPVR
jgi:hypothetical protein